MTVKTKVARHCWNNNRAGAKSSLRPGKRGSMISHYERGTLIAGIIIAIAFGMMFVHAAVML